MPSGKIRSRGRGGENKNKASAIDAENRRLIASSFFIFYLILLLVIVWFRPIACHCRKVSNNVRVVPTHYFELKMNSAQEVRGWPCISCSLGRPKYIRGWLTGVTASLDYRCLTPCVSWEQWYSFKCSMLVCGSSGGLLLFAPLSWFLAGNILLSRTCMTVGTRPYHRITEG